MLRVVCEECSRLWLAYAHATTACIGLAERQDQSSTDDAQRPAILEKVLEAWSEALGEIRAAIVRHERLVHGRRVPLEEAANSVLDERVARWRGIVRWILSLLRYDRSEFSPKPS